MATKPPTRFTREMLAQVLPEREVISFTHGADPASQYFILKTRLLNGATEPLLFPAPLARVLQLSLEEVIATQRYRDVRAPAGQTQSFPAIVRFLAQQPDLLPQDFDGMLGGEPRVVHRLEVHHSRDALWLVLLIDPRRDIYKVHRLGIPIVFYLRDLVAECFENGILHFDGSPPQSGATHH